LTIDANKADNLTTLSIKDNFTLYIFIFWGKNNEIFKN
jgi:hypothetical protein